LGNGSSSTAAEGATQQQQQQQQQQQHKRHKMQVPCVRVTANAAAAAAAEDDGMYLVSAEPHTYILSRAGVGEVQGCCRMCNRVCKISQAGRLWSQTWSVQ
jgi:hypothetical protein